MLSDCLVWLPEVSLSIHHLSSDQYFLLIPEPSFFSIQKCIDDNMFFRNSLGLWCQPETSESSSIKDKATTELYVCSVWELSIELPNLYQINQFNQSPLIIHFHPIGSISLEKFEYHNYLYLPFFL